MSATSSGPADTSRKKLGKRRTVIVAALVAAIVLLASIAWVILYVLRTPQVGPYTVDEFFNELYPFPSPVGTTYPIEDVVVETRVIQAPGLSYDRQGAFIVAPEIRMTFTLVSFASFGIFELHFFGDRRTDFPPGPVRFDITFQEWEERGLTVVGIEHNHIITLLHDYDAARSRGDYTPFGVNVTRENDTLSIRFVSVEDVFPLPADWGDIYVSFWTDPPGPANGTLYGDGSFLALLENPSGSLLGLRNRTLVLPFRGGQELRVSYDGSYSVIRLDARRVIGIIAVP